jgi:hydroxyacylglutathione hydrolase
MLTLYPIPSRSDNYIWALANTDNRKAVIIDPGEAQPVIDWLSENTYTLTDILITHHHHDHIDGLPALIEKYQPTVYVAAQDNIQGTTHALNGGETIDIASLNLSFEVIAIPGHTHSHLAYYAEPYLFCGDTLFSVGCGRVLGGTIEQLHQSLVYLKKLPDDTLVCCAHEYTLGNIHFAKTIDPNNKDLLEYEKQVKNLRKQNRPSLPVLLKTEKAVNPFLRTDLPEVQKAIAESVGQPVTSSFEAFKAMRKSKDDF